MFHLFDFMHSHPTDQATEEYLLLLVRLIDCEYLPPALVRGGPFCLFIGQATASRGLQLFFEMLRSPNPQVQGRALQAIASTIDVSIKLEAEYSRLREVFFVISGFCLVHSRP